MRESESHRAKKSLGQNFLVDTNLQRKIVEALGAKASDQVLEIGPGRGALTDHLAGNVRNLILVELDDQLAARFEAKYRDDPRVTVVHADFLALSLEELTKDVADLKVIGNIPYNITTPILFSLLERRPRPQRIVLMVQREVAERITAPPGSKTYGALTVGVQSVAKVERVLNVARGAFQPAPDVDSAVVRITPHHPPLLEPTTETALRNLTRFAFGQRRKQFQKILRTSYNLSHEEIANLSDHTGFDLQKRPEMFTPEEFVQLAQALEKDR